jgi:hypothetical protein
VLEDSGGRKEQPIETDLEPLNMGHIEWLQIQNEQFSRRHSSFSSPIEVYVLFFK